MSRSTRAGLALLGLLSIADLVGPLLTDGDPPMPVAIVCSALGLATLALLVPAARGSRRALVGLVSLRLLSALLAVPALFVGGVPSGAVVGAAVIVAATVAGVALVLRPSERPAVEYAQ